MKHRIAVQTRVSPEILGNIRILCREAGLSLSEWLRAIILDACGKGEGRSVRDIREGLTRDLTFTVVALDGLLAGHADHDLRPRVHKAYGRKLDERGLRRALAPGGEQ